MWVVRAVQIEDLDTLDALVQSATRGLTSLQLDRNRLLDRVEHSVFAFSRTGMSPVGEPYVLVLVNDETGELVGTSTIYTKTGGYQPFYAYQLTQSFHRSELLGVSHTRHSLQLQRIHDGPTEIGSLFLRGIFRRRGMGRWLSLSRFALIAMLPHRFADRVIAEMRGKADPETGVVPFWEAVSGRFIPTDFAAVDTMSTVSKQFIEEMMPMHPIYLDLLPEDIRAGIGEVHKETLPALKLLKSEGFQETDLVDIFDAGPVVSCPTSEINGVRRTHEVTISEITNDKPTEEAKTILCSRAGGFTSALADVDSDADTVAIDRHTASALQVDVGSVCYTMKLRPETLVA
jgi:arginine N-succinyltransferase